MARLDNDRDEEQEPRLSVVDSTLTLRLTRQDRQLLNELVAIQSAEIEDSGMEATAASYVRGLIRHAAREKGLFDGVRTKKRVRARPRVSQPAPRTAKQVAPGAGSAH